MKFTNEIKEKLNKIAKMAEKEGAKFDAEKALKIVSLFDGYVPRKKYINNAIPVFTNGNLYTTLLLSLFANANKMQLVIDVDEKMPLANKEIASIFEKNVNINKIDLQEIYNFSKSQKKDCIWVVDNTSKFHFFVDDSYPAKNIKIMSLEMYVDESKFDDISEIIENYCDLNLIELDVHKNFSHAHILKRAKMQNGANGFLIFTDNSADFEKISKNDNMVKAISSQNFDGQANSNNLHKQIYINYNPFDRFEIDVSRKFISEF